MSTLSAFPFIGEQSFATPGAFNSPLSIISANIAAVNAAAGSVSGVTITPPSGNTITIASDLSVLGTMAASGPVRIGLSSNVTNYLFLSDTSAARSNYVIGSQIGATADGLNIWDDSGQTMIVSFSKQSVRFFQQVVGPVFDVGGALASTLNAATFGGSDITTQIQAAISAATLAVPKIKRVYIPASMYPFKADRITFDTSVQMVREGGDWAYYDVFAYGALGVGTDDRSIQAAANGAAANGGTVFFPAGTYNISTSITLNAAVNTQFLGSGGNGSLLAMAVSGITLLRFTGVCSNIIIRDLWLGSFTSFAAGGSIEITGTNGTHSDRFLVENVVCQNTPNPVYLNFLDASNFNNLRVISSIASCVRGNALFMKNSVSNVFHEFNGQGVSGTSFPADIVVIGDDCDSIFFANSQANGGIGYGARCLNIVGGTGPRLTRFTNMFCESNTSGGFLIEACRDVRLEDCHTAINGGPGYTVSGGDGVQISNSLAYQNNKEGILISGTSAPRGVSVSGCICTNNGQLTDNTYDGIAVGSGVSGVRIINNRSGDFFLSVTNKQRSGVSIAASTDYITAVNNDTIGNKTAGFTSASTGTNNTFFDQSMVTTSAAGAVTWGQPVFVRDGTALAPSLALASDQSFGWYKFGAKTLQLSGGTLQADQFSAVTGSLDQSNTSNVVRIAGGPSAKIQLATQATVGKLIQMENVGTSVGGVLRISQPGTVIFETGGSPAFFARGVDGTTVAPFWTFTSESSLGWWRSAGSTVKLSYGTLDLTGSGAVTSIASLTIKSGANNSCGTAVLGSNGSVNVANTYVKTGDLIFLTDQTPGGTLGDLEVGGIRNSSGFTIQSTSITDTSTVGWLIVRPG